MKNKVVSAREAVAIIRDGDMIANSGFVGCGTPDLLLEALAERYRETGSPNGLGLVFAAGQGDGKTRGLNRLAEDGLLARVIGGHWGLIPAVARLALEDRIEAWNLPQGAISHLYRDIAGGKPGHFSKVGLGTFVDPRLEGGKINRITRDDLVEVQTLAGEEWLFYKAFPINIAFIRGTTADPSGNITMEREALTLDNLAMAMAAHNSRGFVIAQVERIAEAGSLHPRQVKIPGALVDCVVVADDPDMHRQTYATAYSPAYAAEIRAPLSAGSPMPLDERKIIARRAAFELPINGLVNLGIGMPEGVAAVAAEEHILKNVTLTAEPGVIGGQPASGLDFGAAVNTDAIVDQNQQFDLYDGGGLDLACLGMAQVDGRGNVNVSRFGLKLAGAGGFINISQNAGRLVFVGSFTAGSLSVRSGDGTLTIVQEGKARKCVSAVEQVTFSGAYATARNQPVLYVTERCVFELEGDRLSLVEVAPGIDVDRDILALMDFAPDTSRTGSMDARIFLEAPMGLADDLMGFRISDRLAYSGETKTLFLNFENLHVRALDEVRAIEDAVRAACAEAGQKVNAIVNYDGFEVDELVSDAYYAMVARVVAECYLSVSRYTTSAFLRMKLGDQLARRQMPPHVFESRDEAQSFLQ